MSSDPIEASRSPIVRPLVDDDWPSVAQVVGAAFADDPFWSWVVRDHDRRAARIGTALALAGRLQPASCDAIDDVDRSGVGAFAHWAPPGEWRLPVRDYLRIAPPFLRAVGVSAITKARALSIEDRHHPSEPHWYLGTLATAPAAQSRGLGSALLRHRLATCDRDGVGAYLESSLESNVAFYERFGFRVRDELVLTRRGPRIWTMWRDPA